MATTPSPLSAQGLRSSIRAGISSPRGLGRARLLLPIVLLCSMCLALGACRGTLDGDPLAESSPQSRPEALAGLLPKLALPELQVAYGGRSVAGIRTGYSWELDRTAKQLDEVWPPPRPSDNLLVAPGEDIAFTVTLPAGSPAVTAVKGAVSARLSAWDEHAVDDRREVAPRYSGDCELVDVGPKTVRLSWRMPDMPGLQRSGHALVVKILVKWGDADSSPWVSFYWNLVAVEKGLPDAVLKAARRYFDATWAGDETALTKVSPEWFLAGLEGFPIRSPLRAHLPGPREPILWKSPTHTFKPASPPSFLVDDVYSSAPGPSASCQIEYEVEAKDLQSGETEQQAVRENIRLEAAGDGDWRVSWVSRKSALVEARGDVPGLPGVLARDEEFGAVVRVGPFEDTRPYSGQKWSDDGEWFAFVGQVGEVNGIWAADRDGSRLVNLVGMERTDIQLLDWVPGQHRVRFLSYGYHSCGPHADKTGYWVGEGDLETREVRDIAFIRYPRVSFPKDVAISEAHRYMALKHTPDLWRVDMETGEVTKIAEDVPSWDGLLVLQYSTSGRFAAYSEPFGSSLPGFAVYDIEAVEKRFVDLSDVTTGNLWARFTRWTPKEELTVLVCPADETNHGEDSSHPAAATAIRLYSPTGTLLHEIRPPEGDADDRIGPVAWNADGSVLAMAVGPLSEPIRSHPFGDLWIWHQARAIYVWTRSDGALRKVVDMSGTIESLSWAVDDTAIEAWFRVSDDNDVTLQNGVRIGLDGARLETQRTVPYRVNEGDLVMGSFGGMTLVEKFSRTGGSTLVVRSGTSEESETVVNGVEPLRLNEPVMVPGAFAVLGEVPDTYGEGVHWVYLVVLRQ